MVGYYILVSDVEQVTHSFISSLLNYCNYIYLS